MVGLATRTGGLGGRFARLWAATTITNLADGVLLVVFPLAALRLTRSPILVAGANMAFTLPWFLFAVFAGVLADRRDRRALMMVAGALRALALLILAVTAGLGLLWLPVLYLGGLVLGSAETVSETASQTLIPMVVDRDGLRRGNGYMQGTRIVMNDFVGIPLGGVLAGLVALAFAAPALLYAVAVLVLLGLRGRYAPPRDRPGPVGADIRAGIGYLLGDPVLRSLGLLGAGVNLILTGFLTVFVLFAVGPHSAMGLSESQYGLLLGATATGPLLGAMLTDRLARRTSPTVMLTVVLIGISVGTAVPAVSTNPVLVGLGIAVNGTCGVIATVLVMALRQEHAPSHLLGRVTASFWLLARGALPLGAFVSGSLAEAIGLRNVFPVLAAVALALVPLALRVTGLRTGEVA